MRTPSLEQIQYMEAHIKDTKVPGGLVAIGVGITLTCLVVALRFVSRRMGKVKLEANDWLIVIALGFYLAYSVACLVGIHYGLGKHLITVTNSKALAISLIIAECTIPSTILLVKLSLLSLYCRLFPLPWMRKLSILVALISAINNTVTVLLTILQCIPVKAQWDSTISGKCIDLYPSFLAMKILSFITDAVVLLLPIRPVWRLQISRSQKWQLSIIFVLGGADLIASFIGLSHIEKWRSVDLTWDIVEYGEIGQIQGCVAIIAASLPACRPLVKYLQKKLATKGKTTSQNLTPKSGSEKQTKYRMSAVKTSQESSVNNDSGIDEEQRSYLPLQQPNSA